VHAEIVLLVRMAYFQGCSRESDQIIVQIYKLVRWIKYPRNPSVLVSYLILILLQAVKEIIH